MMTVHKSLFEDHTAIIKMISSGAPLKKIFQVILSSIESYCDSKRLYGSIMLYNPSSNQLEKTVSLSVPKSFISAIEPIDVSLYGGASGTAAFLRHPVLITDIKNNPICEEYRHVALSHGFLSCWTSPLLSSKNELLGTIQLYSKHVGEINKETLKLVDTFSNLASLAIELLHNVPQSLEIENHSQKIHKPNEQILDELYTALEREEFEVYYHPYYCTDEKLQGIEALLRWNHPQLGLLSPSSFLTVVEETGFILDLEMWVLTQSMRNMKKLNENGWTNLSLSVNISAQQFEHPRFPEMVADLLERESFNPNNLILEVTECFLIHKENFDVFPRLKETGIRLSIDDFGTSYSSLQYLKDLKFDEIKIDRSFISHLEANSISQRIVEVIIMLAHRLEINIVAEGVETEAQLDFLKELNCNTMQGFLFTKPVSFEQLINFLTKNETQGSVDIKS